MRRFVGVFLTLFLGSVSSGGGTVAAAVKESCAQVLLHEAVSGDGQEELDFSWSLGNRDVAKIARKIMTRIKRSYGPLVDQPLFAALSQQEELLLKFEIDRMGVALVTDPHHRKHSGTIQIVEFTSGPDGELHNPPFYDSILRQVYAFEGGKGPFLHERLEIYYLLSRWRQSSEQKLFEVMRFSLNGDVEFTERARMILDLFGYLNYYSRFPEAYFFAYVPTKSRARHYHRLYDLRPVEEFFNPKTQKIEYIMMTKGKYVARRIAERYGLHDY